MANVYMVTGGMGCLGAWTLYHLVKQGKKAINFDLSEDRQRLDLLLTREEQTAITFIKGDLTDFKQVKMAFDENSVTHVIHLAALQVPFCRANPVVGSQVNVTGTVNIFEAAKQSNLKHLTSASSIAVYGPANKYPPGLIAHDAPKLPTTLYGVYKVANEGTAEIYWNDYGISSTMFRPYTVYGLGRDQGLTSEPTKAMQAAAKGENYHISFGGNMQFHFASDVALQFIDAAEKPLGGAFAFNLGTPPISVQSVADMIMSINPNVKITVGETILPFPQGFDPQVFYQQFSTIYETPLEAGIRETISDFEKLP